MIGGCRLLVRRRTDQSSRMTHAEQGAADAEFPRSIRLLGQSPSHKHPWRSAPLVALDLENRDAGAGRSPLLKRPYDLFLLAPELLQGHRRVRRVEPITDRRWRHTMRLLTMENMKVRAATSAALFVAPARSNGDRRRVRRGWSLDRWALLRRLLRGRIADQHGCQRESTYQGSCGHTQFLPQGQPELSRQPPPSNRNSKRGHVTGLHCESAAPPAPDRNIKRVPVLPRDPAGEALIYEPVEPAPFAPCR